MKSYVVELMSTHNIFFHAPGKTIWILLMSRAIVIALDKVFFSTKKYLYFSYFLAKTYVVVLIRSASPRRF